ncbi:nonribosomal peptide synthetase MxcG [Branchiibius hedensis]|uniref:Phosphopantetheine attachment site n=1 Tax=Branchiibius hedensis TaxID=672460 RepID=A0A2Y9BPY5_9MICO|nr:phosphopantetheine-binding protein [Branchiibius hedensis]PWJ23323.1 nonribosomal peptide synthetase MxcG [Branchiibius hedensis]SSA59012.1 Phosphopantetheine attachment site [Branchiibius hedensis]
MSEDASSVVVEEWSSALGVVTSSTDDDFFELGGDSLLAVELAHRVEGRLQIEFPIDVMFLDGTLGAVVEACKKRCAENGL